MKSSDLKVVAIILSIALFFTIITSNAVSIASVVILAKGGSGTGAATQTVDPGTGDVQQGTQTTPGGTTSTTPGGSTSTTPGGSTSTTPGGSTSTQQGGTQATPQGGNQGGSTQASPIDKEALAMYQKAAKDIHLNGVAAYNKIGWQVPKKIEGLGFLDKVIMPVLEGFMTTEDEAKVEANPKGSDDAKRRMPISDCSEKYIKSVTKTEKNGNYVITIVMNEQVNPAYDDTDGLVKMSREFLAYADVQKTVKEDPTVSKIVKSLDGEIRYIDYTITAEMTKDGKFVSITHNGIGYITANINGSINAKGELEFNAKYTDFQY